MFLLPSNRSNRGWSWSIEGKMLWKSFLADSKAWHIKMHYRINTYKDEFTPLWMAQSWTSSGPNLPRRYFFPLAKVQIRKAWESRTSMAHWGTKTPPALPSTEDTSVHDAALFTRAFFRAYSFSSSHIHSLFMKQKRLRDRCVWDCDPGSSTNQNACAYCSAKSAFANCCTKLDKEQRSWTRIWFPTFQLQGLPDFFCVDQAFLCRIIIVNGVEQEGWSNVFPRLAGTTVGDGFCAFRRRKRSECVWTFPRFTCLL